MRQIFSTYSTTHCTPLEAYRLSIHMSPLWGFKDLCILRCYKHAAPLGLGWVIGEHLSESRIDADLGITQIWGRQLLFPTTLLL